MKRDGVEAKRSILMPAEKKDYNENASPMNEGEDASCVCSWGKEIPQHRRNTMLDCDSCHRWFHTYCMGIRDSQVDMTSSDPEKILSWWCDACQVKEEVKKQRSLLIEGNETKQNRVEIDEILQQLQINFLTKYSEDFLLIGARQFVIARFLCLCNTRSSTSEPTDSGDIELEPMDTPKETSEREKRLVLSLLEQWPVAVVEENYSNTTMLKDSMMRYPVCFNFPTDELHCQGYEAASAIKQAGKAVRQNSHQHSPVDA